MEGTFAYAVVHENMLLGDDDGRAHIYATEEQAAAVVLAATTHELPEGSHVEIVAVVPVVEDDA